jgi:hypothetical protein
MTTHHALILLLDTHESQYTSYYLLRGGPFVSTTNHAPNPQHARVIARLVALTQC